MYRVVRSPQTSRLLTSVEMEPNSENTLAVFKHTPRLKPYPSQEGNLFTFHYSFFTSPVVELKLDVHKPLCRSALVEAATEGFLHKQQ